MIRIFRKAAQDALQSLTMMKGLGYSYRQMLDKSVNDYYHMPPTGDDRNETIRVAMKNAIEGSSKGDNWDETIFELAKGLNFEASRHKTDGDLIEAIARTLQLPFPRNILSGKTLENLSKAILIPEELGKLNSKLKAREMVCGDCGKGLELGETVTLQGDKNGRVLFCGICMPINMMKCGCGKALGEIPDKITRALRKGIVKCPACKTGAAPTGAGVDGADVEIGVGREAPRMRFGGVGAIPRGNINIRPMAEYGAEPPQRIRAWDNPPALVDDRYRQIPEAPLQGAAQWLAERGPDGPDMPPPMQPQPAQGDDNLHFFDDGDGDQGED